MKLHHLRRSVNLALAVLTCCSSSLSLRSIAQPAARVDDAALKNSGRTGREWLTYGLDYAETRYSRLKQIDASNVSRLKLQWTAEAGPGGGIQEGTPLMSDGVLYAISNWSIVSAFEVATGKMLWRWDPRIDRSINRPPNNIVCCGVVNRGIALYQGKIYVGVLDGRLAAVDAATGQLVWETKTTPPGEPYTITMAPRVVKGKVIIGNSGGDYAVRGYFSAYDAETGKLAWRFYTVPGDPAQPFEHPELEAAAKTWAGEWWKMGGGGTVWDGLAYDPEADLLYVGTGNGGPWDRNLRAPDSGDNLFLCSILAVRPDTGRLVWHYQLNPGENWDFTAVQHLLLADLEIGGRQRKVLMQAPKNGFFYLLDRLTGEFISAQPFAFVNWASGIDPKTGRPIENPAARYGTDGVFIAPGPLGAHNWSPMSFNPATGLVYIPTTADTTHHYARDPNFVFLHGQKNEGMVYSRNRAALLMPPRPAPSGPAGAVVASQSSNPAPTSAAPLPGTALAPSSVVTNSREQFERALHASPPTPAAAASVAATPELPMIGPDIPRVPGAGYLLAWDPVAQKERWRRPGGGGVGGGTVTTAGDLVFQTIRDGRLLAYRAGTGEKLFEHQTGVRDLGPPITYEWEGRQFVSFLGGRGTGGMTMVGGFSIPPPQVLTFALGEPASAPPRASDPNTSTP